MCLKQTGRGAGTMHRAVKVCSASLLMGLFQLATASHLAAQTMVTTTTPLQSNSESFFESSGIGWSVRRPGFFASFGGRGPMPVPFGLFDPNAGLQSGFSVRKGDWRANFNFHVAQGIQRFSSTTAPVLTSIPGQPASFFSGTRRPFVVGLTPIVPGFGSQFSIPSGAVYRPGNGLSPVRQAIANGFRPGAPGQKKVQKPRTQPRTATAQDRSNTAYSFFGGHRAGGPQPVSSPSSSATAASRSGQGHVGGGPRAITPARTLQQELAELYCRKAMTAESGRDFRAARLYYRKALSSATGVRHREIQQRLDALPD